MQFPVVSFVGPKNLLMSSLVAQKIINLNPIPNEIIFITPDVKKLKTIHDSTLKTNNIPYRYLQDDYVAQLCGIDLSISTLGWLHRQWIQLHLDIVIPNFEYILTCDSDLVVNRSLDLITNKRWNYFIETEHYEPYFTTIREILPNLKTFLPRGQSFNSEIMLLISEQLKSLRNAMNISHKDWNDICVKNRQKGSTYAFSEYETIGTWMINHAMDEINLVQSDTFNKSMLFSGKHKLSELLQHQQILPLRCVTDQDISWFE